MLACTAELIIHPLDAPLIITSLSACAASVRCGPLCMYVQVVMTFQTFLWHDVYVQGYILATSAGLLAEGAVAKIASKLNRSTLSSGRAGIWRT